MLVYVDTSVFGGALDAEFQRGSQAFFERVREGAFEVAVSALVLDELKPAPARVRSLFEELEPRLVLVDTGKEAYDLQEAYLEAKVVGRKWETDALHVATATIRGCRAIVSWNFRHIVNFGKIPLYNGVNLVRGYPAIAIHTPLEVISYDDEDEGF
ncbi:MAG: type II toxin-antitoxin system VapC family toxin [bacterium]|nr:type II toxin-antitoxin system VapC family toxin [bacterium]